MATGSQETKQLELWLNKHREGDEAARDALINFSCDRVRRMTQRYLANDPRVHRWESTDDVLQVALLKLHKALEKIKPVDLLDYMGLAARQIRWTLTDLARHYYGKEGIGQNHATDAAPGQDGLPARVAAAADSADGPEDLAMRAEFHELVEGLPEDQREIIDLTVYHGLEQKEVAEMLGISASTVKRRKRDALITLSERLGPEYQ